MTDIITYYRDQIEWSRATFGPGLRSAGILNHILKEVKEIEADPFDLFEWVDIVILAMDGFWRHGGTPELFMNYLLDKQRINKGRDWPDWQTMSEDQAIEHKRD